MELSTVTSKYQATIPLLIRNMLGIKGGDKVAFEVENNRVFLKKLDDESDAYLRMLDVTMSEWSSDEDEQLFKDL